MAIEINIFDEGDFGIIPEIETNQIVKSILTDHKIADAIINLIYVDDEEIHRVNLEYLKHDYPTDVITFVLEDDSTEVDIFIGVETAIQNSIEFGVTKESELLRLVAHGVLHAVGMDDQTDEERLSMHNMENKYLGIINEK